MNDDVPTDLIGVVKAAKLIGVQARTLRGWVHAGKLAGWRMAGSRILVSRADVLGCIRPVPLRPRPVLVPTQRAVAARDRHTEAVLRKHGLLDY
jgi:excisionase family DNA binding protein